MLDSTVRSQLIRLAHDNKELRAQILPLLTSKDHTAAEVKQASAMASAIGFLQAFDALLSELGDGEKARVVQKAETLASESKKFFFALDQVTNPDDFGRVAYLLEHTLRNITR